jgi:hypothetical protein
MTMEHNSSECVMLVELAEITIPPEDIHFNLFLVHSDISELFHKNQQGVRELWN